MVQYLCYDMIFFSPEVAFEIVYFLCEHSEKLQQSTNVFSKCFPNIFKVMTGVCGPFHLLTPGVGCTKGGSRYPLRKITFSNFLNIFSDC